MKAIKPLLNIHLDEDDLHGSIERGFDVVKNSLQGIIASPIIAGTLLSDISLTTTAARIEHKLGRKPLGYLVVRRNANAVIYDQDEPREDLFLNLKSSASVTVSLWVF